MLGDDGVGGQLLFRTVYLVDGRFLPEIDAAGDIDGLARGITGRVIVEGHADVLRELPNVAHHRNLHEGIDLAVQHAEEGIGLIARVRVHREVPELAAGRDRTAVLVDEIECAELVLLAERLQPRGLRDGAEAVALVVLAVAAEAGLIVL